MLIEEKEEEWIKIQQTGGVQFHQQHSFVF